MAKTAKKSVSRDAAARVRGRRRAEAIASGRLSEWRPQEQRIPSAKPTANKRAARGRVTDWD